MANVQAEAEAALLLGKKLKKGYVRVGSGVGRASAVSAAKAPVLKKSTTRKRETKGSAEQRVTEALVAWVKAAASHLKAPLPKLRSVTYAKGIVCVTTDARQPVRGKVSAPVSLLAALWRDQPNVLERVCLEPLGRWNDVVTLVRCEGAAHDRYMELVSAVHDAGHDQEARLAWLQAKFMNDPDDRKEPLFRELFQKLPRSAASTTASSSAALLKRCLPLAKSADAVDALVVATELYNYMDDAFDDVAGSGKRAQDLFALIEEAIAILAQNGELAVRDLARLNRLQFARSVALAPDEPR